MVVKAGNRPHNVLIHHLITCCHHWSDSVLLGVMNRTFSLSQQKRKPDKACPDVNFIWGAYNTPKTESQFYALLCPSCHQSFGLLRPLLRICRGTACHCPAIIEYHQGSIPAPSYAPSALHYKHRQVIHSLPSGAMNCFTVISPQGCGIMSNLLLCCACRILIVTEDDLVQLQFMYLWTCRSGFGQYCGVWRPLEVPQEQMCMTMKEPYGGHNEACLEDLHREKQSNLLNVTVFAISWDELFIVIHYFGNSSFNNLVLCGLHKGPVYWQITSDCCPALVYIMFISVWWK